MSLIDDKWRILFDKYRIEREIEKHGRFYITADQIREVKEPRLMTKFDTRESLPRVFGKKISILPVSRGGYVLGVCNGFQVLTELGLLPGALMRNSGLKFVCREVGLRVATAASPYTGAYAVGEEITVPVAHHDGNYQIDAEGLAALKDQDRIAFTYASAVNGSVEDIAGILSANRRVLGMMPHPERAAEPVHGGTDGAKLFASVMGDLVAA